MSDTRFDSIESAHEYVHLLGEALEETQAMIRQDIDAATGAADLERRLDALRLVDYKLHQLQLHIRATSLLLNDLRTLRRLLLTEREETVEAQSRTWSTSE